PTRTYTLSLHDALPIFIDFAPTDGVPPPSGSAGECQLPLNWVWKGSRIAVQNQTCVLPVDFNSSFYIKLGRGGAWEASAIETGKDRKSTRLNSSHRTIS